MPIQTPHMSGIQRFLLTAGGLLFVVATIIIAVYVFAWLLVVLAVVIPVGYLWLRYRLRKLRKQQTGSPNGTVRFIEYRSH